MSHVSLSSPRVRGSLAGSGKAAAHHRPPLSPGARGPPALTPAISAEWPFAPRSARYRLAEVRKDVGMTPAHFSAALSTAIASAGRAKEAPAVTAQLLLSMESGFALVQPPVLAAAEQLAAHAEEEARKEAGEAGGIDDEPGGVYPHQEPMLGPDYQTTTPRYVGGAGGPKAISMKDREDALVFNPRAAAAKGVEVEAYLELVGALLEPAAWLSHSEEVALAVLHDLKYSQAAALAALKLTIAWQSDEGVQAADMSSRGVVANSMLWLQRLRAAAARGAWGDGEREALHAGIETHGKELAVVHEHVLREKSRQERAPAPRSNRGPRTEPTLDRPRPSSEPSSSSLPSHLASPPAPTKLSTPPLTPEQELIEMYYVVGWRHQSP